MNCTQQTEVKNTVESTAKNWSRFGLRSELLRTLDRRGFTEPTPVQAEVLSLEDRSGNLVVQAKTGSGKTLAFVLPLFDDMTQGERRPRVLVLSPTRELALQIAREAQWFGRDLGIRAASLVGGMSMETQTNDLRQGSAIIVGTPGRTLDHIRRGTLDMSQVHTVVLDEGDHMLDLGFREELEAILNAATNRTRTWLFSATMPDEVLSLAKNYMKTPTRISLCSERVQHEDIAHRVYLAPERRRIDGLVNVLLWERPQRTLVFCPTRSDTMTCAEKLAEEGFAAGTLHGEMTQRERNTVLGSFRQGRTAVLVATNVAARGLDVAGVTHVIQMGLPDGLDTFVHRSGRTGRAGHEGRNVVILSPREAGRFRSMLRGTDVQVEWLPVPDAEEIGRVGKTAFEETLLAENPDAAMIAWAEELLGKSDDPASLVAALLGRTTHLRRSGYSLAEELERETNREKNRRFEDRPDSRNGRSLGKRESGTYSSGRSGGRTEMRGAVMRLEKGRSDGWDVGRVLREVCIGLRVNREEVGSIRLREDHVLVELSPLAEKAFEKEITEFERRGLVRSSGASRSRGTTGNRREWDRRA
jgi:ATP-dependent RNA helicase DeaD